MQQQTERSKDSQFHFAAALMDLSEQMLPVENIAISIIFPGATWPRMNLNP